MRHIQIDAPEAGEWIMDRVSGSFDPSRDHSFATYHGDRILGGIAVCEYRHGSMVAHMAGEDTRWFSRELAWLACDYVFNQLGCLKLLTFVHSDNIRALNLIERGGWIIEAVIRDVFWRGGDLVVLSMTPEGCRWLRYQPRYFKSNIMVLLPE